MHLRHIQAVALGDAGRPRPVQAAVPCEDPNPLAGIPLAGDVVERIAKRLGAKRLMAWWEAKTGLPCGCARRQELLNEASKKLLKWAGVR